MKKILITGANSFVGTNIERWLGQWPEEFHVDTVDTMNDAWKEADFSNYDTVFHVAGIAHVDPKPKMAPLYYKVNRDLTIEIAKWAKEHGVKQFIFMSSKIVYHTNKSLKGNVVTPQTKPNPNDFYGDSKLQAENGLQKLECDTFKVAIIRPPMIYGSNAKGNFLRLGWLATKTPIFPAWHNKRSMIYIDNLAEFIKNLIELDAKGIFFPQNKELVDTVEVVRYFAHKYDKRIWITKCLNPFVVIGSWFLKPICKMFSNSYYIPEMSQYNFEYQIVGFKDSLRGIEITEKNRRMK